MKAFIAKNYVLILFALALLIFLSLLFFWRSFNIKQKFPVSPLINSINYTTNESYELKNLKVKSYGFLPFWSVDSYVPNYNAITDLAYFSLYLNANGTIKKQTKPGVLEPGYRNLKDNKKIKDILNQATKNGVRTSLTISLHNNKEIEEFLNCSSCWFYSYDELNSIISTYGFSGLNFDFEYIGNAPISLSNKYTDYIEYMSSKFKASRGSDFQIVISVFADSAKKPRLTDIEGLNKIKIDYLFIMAYDFFVPTSPTSGPIAPIGGAPERYKYDLNLMFKDFREKISPNKLILGIAFYGHNWVVQTHTPLAIRIPGNPYLGYSISQNYKDIAQKIVQDNLTVGWDSIAQAPFIDYYKGSVARKVYFENSKSISKKIELAQKNLFAGVGIWALGYDGKYKDLINLYKDYLDKNN